MIARPPRSTLFPSTTLCRSPILAISKADGPDPVAAGGNITYTLSYSNTGNQNATGVVITDTIPANTSFVSATGGGTLAAGAVTWNIGALAAGGVSTVQLGAAGTRPPANRTAFPNNTYSITSTDTG